jgi:hypothetical protein
MVEVKLLPYEESDGQLTFKDSQIKLLYRYAKAEGKLDEVFCASDLNQVTEDDFLAAYKHGHSIKMWVALAGNGRLAGWCWIDDIQRGRARFHYMLFQWVRDRTLSLTIAKGMLHQILHLHDEEGNYLFNTLVGEIPVTNKPAIKFISAMGAKVVGSIPKYRWHDAKGKMVDVVFCYITRET